MTTTIAPAAGRAPALGGLVRSEFLRARSRRSLRWLVALALLAVVGVAVIMWFTTARVTGADLEAATQQFLAEQTQFYQDCIDDPIIPEDQKAMACWKPTEEEARSNSMWLLTKRAFDRSGFEGLVGLAGGIGVLVVAMLGATSGGADWGARTMGLLLSWEPRRTRVFLVRLGVLMVIALAVQAILALLAVAVGSVIAHAHPLDLPAGAVAGFDPASVSVAAEFAARWVPLAALAAAGSYALAMLTRSTGWAIAAAIGFVVVVESLIRGLWPWGSQWLIQTNAAAWLNGGLDLLVDRAAAERTTGFLPEGTTMPGYLRIDDTRAIATLVTLVAFGCLISGWSLRKRDVE
jgi:ABC-2 type transport system permease protein